MVHTCHAAGCNRAVPPAMLMCAPHWRRVPRALQRQVWATYRAGQETDKRPSAAYMVAHHLAVEAVARAEGRDDDAANHAMQATMHRERMTEAGGTTPPEPK